MQKKQFLTTFIFILAVGVVMQGCSLAERIGLVTPTPTKTVTLTLTPTPTNTFTPTVTSTSTPNLFATEQYNIFFSLVQSYYDSKYIPSLKGKYRPLTDFSDSFAGINEYRSYPLGLKIRNFILKSHVVMRTSNTESTNAGCGYVFHILGSNAFFDIIYFAQDDRVHYSSSGTYISDRYFGKISNSEEFDIVLISYEKQVRFFIDGKQAFYSDLPIFVGTGDLGFVTISGPKDSFATRCDFTNNELWSIIR